jgi:hypothetical protein
VREGKGECKGQPGTPSCPVCGHDGPCAGCYERDREIESLKRDLDERTRPYIPMKDVEPLSLSGIGQVYRNPASRCEQALCEAIVKMQAEMLEARSHLGAAISQSIDKDDQIIMDHVRDAARILGWKS